MTDDVDVAVDVDVERLVVVSASGAMRALLAEADPGLLSGAACLQVAEVLARTEKAFAAARMRFAARAADCGAHGSLGFASGEEWAARLTGSSVGQARDELALAEKLATCPLTSAALAGGELSLAQAVEIARTEKALPGTEAAMVGLADTLSLGALRDEGRKRRLAALDPGEAYKRQHRERSFRSWTDAAGMIRFHGALTPDKGVPFQSRLGAVCDRLHREARRAGSTESREAHAADAFVALLDGDCDCSASAASAGWAGAPNQSSDEAQSSAQARSSAGSAGSPGTANGPAQAPSSAGSGPAGVPPSSPRESGEPAARQSRDGGANVHAEGEGEGGGGDGDQAVDEAQADGHGWSGSAGAEADFWGSVGDLSAERSPSPSPSADQTLASAGGQPAGGGPVRKPKRSPSVELVLLWDVDCRSAGPHPSRGDVLDPGRRPDVGRGGARAGYRCLRQAGDP